MIWWLWRWQLQMFRCEAPLSLHWEKEVDQLLVALAELVVQELVELEELVATIRLLLSPIFNIIIVTQGQMYWYCVMITREHPDKDWQTNWRLKYCSKAIWRAVVDACSGSRKGQCTFSLEEHLRWGKLGNTGQYRNTFSLVEHLRWLFRSISAFWEIVLLRWIFWRIEVTSVLSSPKT